MLTPWVAIVAEKFRPLGHLEVENCWRVCFAWHERTRECRAHPAALIAMRLSVAPTLDALASVRDTSTQRAFRPYKQATQSAFDPAFNHGEQPLQTTPSHLRSTRNRELPNRMSYPQRNKG